VAPVVTGGDPSDPAVARLLDDPAVWAEVSPDLRARTLAAATASAGPAHAAGRGRLRPRRSHRLLLAAAAVVLLGAVVAGGLSLTRDTTPAGVEVALAGSFEGIGTTKSRGSGAKLRSHLGEHRPCLGFEAEASRHWVTAEDQASGEPADRKRDDRAREPGQRD